jgi:Spy/CpxP family protein refolding chaperone
MKRMLILTAMTMTLLAALAAVALAQEPPPEMPGGGAPMNPPPGGGPSMGPPPPFWLDERVVQALGLTDKQIAALDDAADAMDQRAEANRAALKSAHRELDRALGAATIDQAKVRQLGSKVADLEAARVNLMVEHRLQISQILTPEQRNKLRTLQPPREGRHPHGPR